MKSLLMHPDCDFDWQRDLPPHAEDLVHDLGLDVLFRTMAGGDAFHFNVAQRAVLWSLTDPPAIVHRQQAWTDCARHPEVVRAIYDLTVETLTEKRKIFSWFGQWPEMNLHHAVDVLQLLVRMLNRLRQIAIDSSPLFESPAFSRFFAMLLEELDDSYFQVINDHLERLKFRRGVVVSAKLGRGNAGVDFVLRRPLHDKRHWSEVILGPRDGRLWFDVHPRDDAGHQALAELRNRGINLVADALSQSADHVLGFFVQLRAELSFYLGCLNLKTALDAKGCITCLPYALPSVEKALSAQHLYDMCLALTVEGGVVDNDVAANGKRLVVITGANKGGKSTLLRGLGLAQLMMQAGMLIGASEFQSSVASGLFTHFKREEDETMESGKLDEELSRMSRIVDRIQPDGILICNESFASTNEREGAAIGEEVIGALNDTGVKVLLVTHLFELADRLRREQADGVLFLRAERLPDGRRTFKINEGEALPTSFGKDLYEEIFGGAG
jgi:hypothetical protein